jgi:hypothetical protein
MNSFTIHDTPRIEVDIVTTNTIQIFFTVIILFQTKNIYHHNFLLNFFFFFSKTKSIKGFQF